MKITERQLRRIISEEMAIVLERLTSKTWSGDSSSGGGSGGSGGRSAVKGALKTVGAKPGEKKQTQEPTDQDNPEGYMIAKSFSFFIGGLNRFFQFSSISGDYF